MTLLLSLYRVAMTLFGPAATPYLRRRTARGKEEPGRLSERRGVTKRARPAGRLVWLHGASIGEGLALLPLVERLVSRGFEVLVTTGTVSSARILGERLPAGARHQFVPLDVPSMVRRFLDHWRPELAILAESELWPTLMIETTRRSIPLVLVNGRLSRRSFERWRRLPRFIGPLLGLVDLCLAQSAADAERFLALGMPRVTVAGNLKFDASPPPADLGSFERLADTLGPRPLWLAASTHPDEEALLLDVHARLAAGRPDVLTIIAPRHADRGVAIAAAAAARGLVASRRSLDHPVTAETGLYVADTMGELGLLYRLAPVVFMGKSLGETGGGQNPLEPAKLGCCILHGPAVANFADIYALLDSRGGARQVVDGAALTETVARLLDEPDTLDAMAGAAAAAIEAGAGATDTIMAALERFLGPTTPILADT